ncbi:MAG: RNA methyltransferase [Steroidobacteraceae bacterium]
MAEIRIVLVEPSHPGNIGAAARAMLNMSLRSLVLVRPRQFPHPEASARASGAEGVLGSARVVDSLREAIAGCGFVAATTSRERDQNFRVLDAREAARRIVAESGRAPAAVLFGAERTGLTNEDLEPSHALVRIPSHGEYASLNLAMAVQIIAYELFLARLEQAAEGPAGADRLHPGPPSATPPSATPLATPEEMERLYVHLAEVMDEVGFRDRTQSGTHLMGRIRRFLQLAELDENEANILRGLLTAVQQRRRPAG